jgi:RNA polymerase sigma-70 factor (ECF subfamily)
MKDRSRNSEFVGLLTPNYYKVHSYILTLVPNKTDAEDILQTTITYMLEHFNDFTPGTDFLAWAVTISKYHILSYRKKKKRSIVHFSEEAIRLIELEHRRLSDELDARLDVLGQCMKKLPPVDLTFLNKRYENRMSVIDMASEFEISVHIAYKRLARIKHLLLRCIHKTMNTGDVS